MCKDCDSGYYSYIRGAEFCDPCEQGKYSDETG